MFSLREKFIELAKENQVLLINLFLLIIFYCFHIIFPEMASGFRCISLRASSNPSTVIWSKTNHQTTSVDLAVNSRVSNLLSNNGIQCYTDKPKVYLVLIKLFKYVIFLQTLSTYYTEYLHHQNLTLLFIYFRLWLLQIFKTWGP